MRAIDISARPSLFGFTRYEWRVFFVVWLGWALDATDFNLFSLVLKPAVTEISGHAIWLPELFPTYVRATSLSFCNGTGRIITSFGPLVAGLLAGAFGGNFNLACAVMTFFATLSLLAVLIGSETRHQQLPE